MVKRLDFSAKENTMGVMDKKQKDTEKTTADSDGKKKLFSRQDLVKLIIPLII